MSNGKESFPVRLHQVLMELEKMENQHMMSWCSHGRSFTINNRKMFCEAILPL